MSTELIEQPKISLFKQRADALFSEGASAHFVASELKIPYEDAVELGRQYGEEIRSGAADHRLALRHMIRAQLPGALCMALDVMKVAADALKKGQRPLSKDQQGTAKVALEAVKIVVALGKDVIGDDVVNAFTERPRKVAQPTIFDYAAEIQDDGSTVLKAIPRQPDLKLIQGGKETKPDDKIDVLDLF
jgi:hypothetical protein